MANLIPKVDDNNNLLGETTIPEAKANGWPRRVVRIIILSLSKEEVLLQKRAASVHSFPDHWETSASGHVDVGETELQSATRETKEELGIDVELKEIIRNKFSDTDGDKFFNSIYLGVIAKETSINLDLDEVSEAKWFSVAELDSLVVDRVADCTPGLVAVWQTYRDKLLE